MNATLTRPSNKYQRQGAQEDPNKNKTGYKVEHGQYNRFNKLYITAIIIIDKEANTIG
jgi:hypothetical protein